MSFTFDGFKMSTIVLDSIKKKTGATKWLPIPPKKIAEILPQ